MKKIVALLVLALYLKHMHIADIFDGIWEPVPVVDGGPVVPAVTQDSELTDEVSRNTVAQAIFLAGKGMVCLDPHAVGLVP